MSDKAQAEYTVRLRSLRDHPKQESFVRSAAKRKIVRAGRRGGKTVGVSVLSVEQFLEGRRILYATPTTEQIETYWREVKAALAEPIEAGIFYKNETEHVIEVPGTKQRIRAKTAWNADTMRGDYADLLILDEWQLMSEDAWELVGAPMLLDNNGDAVFVYTPPSLHSRSVSKAKDPRHASKLFAKALADQSGRWKTFAWSSHDNPGLSSEALDEIVLDMTQLAYRQEILAEDIKEIPGALWKLATIDKHRVTKAPDDLAVVAVGVDPPGGTTECGIVAAGVGLCRCSGPEELHGFVLADRSLKAPPDQWAAEAAATYNDVDADRLLGERNFGGDMVEATIKTADPAVRYKEAHASRGKAVRAEPVAALYEQGKVHHVGVLSRLEDEMCSWIPGVTRWSPNRMDALVWVLTDLMVSRKPAVIMAAPTGVGGGSSYWRDVDARV